MTLERRLYVVVREKDSPIDLPLRVQGAAVSSTGVTRCDLTFKRDGVADIGFSSDNEPTWFSLQESAIVDSQSLEIIRLDLRLLPDPPAEGRYEVDVYIWDAEFTNGRLWGTIDVEVRDAPPDPEA